MSLERQSPCKINLLLNILGRRDDGFHELETLLHPVPVHDILAFEKRARSSSAPSRVELSCSDPALPTDSGNLVHRAATAFLEAAGIREAVRIHLEKQVPLSAGLGGGSSNAAVTLLGLNELFGRPLEDRPLHDLATRLGSDVPFFLQSRPALATGRGDRIDPVDFFPALEGVWLLLIHPGFGVSTAWAYANLARFPAALAGTPWRARRLAVLLAGNDLQRAGGEFYNSFEAPVFSKYPVLELYRDFLRAHGARVAMMSGSGSTTFAFADSEAKARQLHEQFRKRFGDGCWTRIVPLRVGGV